jgi:hypothetical protein
LPSMPCLSVMYFFSVNLVGTRGRRGRASQLTLPLVLGQVSQCQVSQCAETIQISSGVFGSS